MNRRTLVWLVVAVLLAVAAAVMYWSQQRPAAPPPPGPPTEPIAVAPAPAPSVPAAPQPPAIVHPVEPAPPPQAKAAPRELPPPDQAGAYVADALAELFGRKSVLTFLNVERFVAQFVATVDNLDRTHAPARSWPVHPTPQRFSTIEAGGTTVIAAENARRYAPLVQFVASIDTARAAALYRHLYPLFQHAYEQLGYPGRYFNDRLVQVIDHLLQAPSPEEPIAVRLTEVKGPYESTRPWVRYEFADPALESRSAGQKILMRIGRGHADQLKAKLAEFRKAIARAPR